MDNLHSVIERALPEEMSPISLVWHLEAIKPSGQQMFSHVMKASDFRDFGAIVKTGFYSHVNYAKAEEIACNKASVTSVSYSEEMGGTHSSAEVIAPKRSRSGLVSL